MSSYSVDTINIAVIIISYGHEKYIEKLAPALKQQCENGDEIIIVDNKQPYELKNKLSAQCKRSIHRLEEHPNGGYAAGCNYAVNTAGKQIDAFLFINPDTQPAPNLLFEIRKELMRGKYTAIMPLITLPNGRINSAGNLIHMSGLSWCDGLYEKIEKTKNLSEVKVLSGACFAIRTADWHRLGGMSENYFMYYEDTDLSSRITLSGGSIGMVSSTHIVHDYHFTKGDYKYLYIERNIPLYIIKNWPVSVILLLLPINIVYGIGFLLEAILQRRLRIKVRSFFATLSSIPTFLAERKIVQEQRTISSYDFFLNIVSRIDTPLINNHFFVKLSNPISDFYYRTVRFLLRSFEDKKRFTRFLISGGSAASVEYLSFIVLQQFHTNIVFTNSISFLAGLLVSFTLNKTWVFKANGRLKEQFTLYLSLAVVNLFISDIFIFSAVHIFNLDPLIAKLVVMGVIASWNFLIFQKIIFNNKSLSSR